MHVDVSIFEKIKHKIFNLLVNYILKIIWPLVFRFRKKIYPFKLKYFQYKLKSDYKDLEFNNSFHGIILMFDDHFSSGGLVDRIKGVVSAFYLSQITNNDFHIYFKNPNDPFIDIINKFNVSLILNKRDLILSKYFSYPILWHNYLPKFQKNLLNKFKIGKQIHLYTNMNVLPKFYETKEDSLIKWSQIFKNLFSFSKFSKLTQILFVKKQRTVGIHFRFIGLLDDFVDLRKHTISNNSRISMIEWCFDRIIEIAMKNLDSSLIILSDSPIFLKYLHEKNEFSFLKNRIYFDYLNIGHTAIDNDKEIFNKAMFDFITLSKCDVIYQLRYGKMHNSDFSRYASYVNRIEFNFIENVLH